MESFLGMYIGTRKSSWTKTPEGEKSHDTALIIPFLELLANTTSTVQKYEASINTNDVPVRYN